MMRIWFTVFVVLVISCAAVPRVVAQEPGPRATGSGSVAASAKVAGTAGYRERIALLPGAVFEATLEDVSRAGAKATVLGTARVENASAVPTRFEIPYDPNVIDPGHTYAVRARIVVNGKLAFTTDRVYPVLSRGAASSVELLSFGFDLRRRSPAALPTRSSSTPALGASRAGSRVRRRRVRSS